MVVYPFTGFHFLVTFGISPKLNTDARFQSVDGLKVEVTMETYREGGENRFIHQLPVRNNFSDLVLKRGLTPHSEITAWCGEAIQNFHYKPVNLLISLLNEQHEPAFSWQVINAIPSKLEIAGLDAEQNQIVIETLTLKYQYFKIINLTNAPQASGIVKEITSSTSISVP